MAKAESKPDVFELQVVSDLHLEHLDRKHKEWKHQLIQPVCDTIATLGDLCELQHEALWLEFITYLSQHWKTVLVVNGNHEYHNDERVSMSVLQKRQKELLLQLDNVYLLDNSEFEVTLAEGRRVVIWGGTFWTHISDQDKYEVPKRIRDYNYAYVDQDVITSRRFRVCDTNAMHEEAVLKLHERITREPETPVVVLTHHAPLRNGTSAPQYEQDRKLSLNSAFSSDQSGLFKPNVKLWAFGHTHWHADFIFRTTQVVSNPHGYGIHDACGKSFCPDWVLKVPV